MRGPALEDDLCGVPLTLRAESVQGICSTPWRSSYDTDGVSSADCSGNGQAGDETPADIATS